MTRPALRPGQRVRVLDGCVWPERVGCTGVIVDGPHDVYPWHGLGRGEVVVLLDHDPADALVGTAPFAPRQTSAERGWSCTMDRAWLTPVD